MTDLEIRYYQGSMIIHMENFFPTTKTTLKKLLKVVEMDWNNRDEIIESMKKYITEQIPLCEAELQKNGKQYWNFHQKVEDIEQVVKSRKRPNGVMMSKDELKKERENLKKYNDCKRYHLRRAKKFQKEKKQYTDCLEYLTSI